MARANTRSKAPALAVPQSDAEADALLAEYGAKQRVLADCERRMQEQLAKVKVLFEGLAEPNRCELKTLFERLQAYAEANRARLTEDGKSKTVTLPAGKLSWRTRPPSIRLADKVENVIERLRGMRLGRFIRVKYELDKEEMLNQPSRWLGTIAGVKLIVGEEDFAVEPFAPELAEPLP